MRSARLHRLLAGTAVAVVLPLALSLAAAAQDASKPSAVEAPSAAAVAETATPAAEPKAPERAAVAKPADATPAPKAAEPKAAETKPAMPAAETTVAAPAQPSEPPSLDVKDVKDAVTAGADIDAAWRNAAVADKLRDLAKSKFSRLIDRQPDRDGAASFYEARDYKPLWIDNGAINARGKAAIRYLAGVAADGLNPADYPTPTVAAGADAAALANAELELTNSVLTFARHAESGRVHFTRISADISYDLERPDPKEVLTKLAGATDVAAALDGYNPPQPGYKALKAALAKARTKPEEKPDVIVITGGPMLRPGTSDPRVVDVRKRLGITENPDSPVYDDTVVAAVKAFQDEKGLGTDGVLGPNTLRAMNGKHAPTAGPVNAIIATMERWRWLPRDLGRTYVMVNIPDFTLRVVRDNKLVWKTKIVVGKPNLRTPLTSALMKYITVNPTWNVPPSIIRNEYLPVIQRDPTALDRYGLKMEENPDGTVRIYQPPGDRNALGRIRFNFPNKFLVYQHDTPDKHLFKRETRAYSHGCMRVENPIKYGEVILSLALPGEGYTQARLRKMFGGSEININFPRPIPVHLTYQTAFVDEDGTLQLRSDIYGWDREVLSWLNGSQRKVADVAIVRPKSDSSKPVMMPDGLIAGRDSGPSFFDRLFGVAPEPRRGYRRRSSSGGGPRGGPLFFN